MNRDDKITFGWGIAWLLSFIGMLFMMMFTSGCCSMCKPEPCEPQIQVVEKIVVVHDPAPCLTEELPIPELWLPIMNMDVATLDGMVAAAIHDNAQLVNYIKVIRTAVKCKED